MLEKSLAQTGRELSEISTGQSAALAKVQEISDQITCCQVGAAALGAERQSAEVAREHLKELASSMQGDQEQKKQLITRLQEENRDTQP